MAMAQWLRVPSMTHRFLIMFFEGKPSSYWGLIILSHSQIAEFWRLGCFRSGLDNPYLNIELRELDILMASV